MQSCLPSLPSCLSSRALWCEVRGADDGKLFLADTETKFSLQIGWMMGDTGRNARWAMVVDDGKVVYAERETKPGEIGVRTLFLSRNESSNRSKIGFGR